MGKRTSSESLDIRKVHETARDSPQYRYQNMLALVDMEQLIYEACTGRAALRAYAFASRGCLP